MSRPSIGPGPSRTRCISPCGLQASYIVHPVIILIITLIIARHGWFEVVLLHSLSS